MPEQSGVGNGCQSVKDVKTSKAARWQACLSACPFLKTLSGRETSRKQRRLARVAAVVRVEL
jgi:Mlc titration factor MtfA (ptsG expression regulator)